MSRGKRRLYVPTVTGGTGGTAQLMFRPEVAASATCKANSVMRVMKVA